jgi:hypothetical protein
MPIVEPTCFSEAKEVRAKRARGSGGFPQERRLERSEPGGLGVSPRIEDLYEGISALLVRRLSWLDSLKTICLWLSRHSRMTFFPGGQPPIPPPGRSEDLGPSYERENHFVSHVKLIYSSIHNIIINHKNKHNKNSTNY